MSQLVPVLYRYQLVPVPVLYRYLMIKDEFLDLQNKRGEGKLGQNIFCFNSHSFE